MKRKIPVSSPQAPLQSPFVELKIPGLPLEKIEDSPGEPLAKIGHKLILSKEKAHRAGKTVLIVRGFSLETGEEAISLLAKEAKAACGCGGTVVDRKIELQGDQPERVRRFFESKGFRLAGVR